MTGAIDVSVLYENDSGVLYSAVGNLPFRYETGANGAQGDVTVRCKVAVCDLTGAIKDGAVAVDAALMLCAFVAEEDTVESVRALQRDGDAYPEKEDGVLRVFYPEPGESLYSVGKRYHVAVDTLRQANGLEPNVLAADEKTKLLMIP